MQHIINKRKLSAFFIFFYFLSILPALGSERESLHNSQLAFVDLVFENPDLDFKEYKDFFYKEILQKHALYQNVFIEDGWNDFEAFLSKFLSIFKDPIKNRILKTLLMQGEDLIPKALEQVRHKTGLSSEFKSSDVYLIVGLFHFLGVTRKTENTVDIFISIDNFVGHNSLEQALTTLEATLIHEMIHAIIPFQWKKILC